MNNNANANQQQTQGNGQRQKFEIFVKEKPKFTGTLNGEITTSIDLCKHVNSLFKKVFPDYEGSVMLQNQFGQPTLTLFFREQGGGDIIPIGSNMGKTNSPTDRLNRMNLRNRNKTYVLSEKLTDVVEQFTTVYGRTKINWDRKVTEIANQTYGGLANIIVQIEDIDINKILKAIYGEATEDGDKLEYNVTVIKPIGMGGMGQQINYMVKVDQLNLKKIDELSSKIGLMPSTGSVPMVRA